MSKHLLIIIPILLLIIAALLLLFNRSYQLSLEAKYYYEIKDYKKAMELSKEAFELDKYNRMAFNIMTQSKISLEYEEYIKEAKDIYNEIIKIASSDSISSSDKTKVKLMCEVVIGKYNQLTSSTKITDKELVIEAQNIYQKLKRLYDDVYK